MPPMGLTVLDLSAYVGLIAVGAITLNMLLGLLMALRYRPHRSWPHHQFNYFRFHNWTGYIALAVSILQPIILLFNKNPHFRIRDLVYPVQSPSQPLDNTIGALVLYLLAFVVVTSYLRIRLGRCLFRSRRAFLAQPIHRSRLEKFVRSLVQRRQTLRPNLACSSSPPSACCACAMLAKKHYQPAKSLGRQPAPRLNDW
jgi:hypothetical protein